MDEILSFILYRQNRDTITVSHNKKICSFSKQLKKSSLSIAHSQKTTLYVFVDQ